MDGILGIVSEYNPFHNGHLHHLEISKQITKAAFTVVVMSGNFVQRGDTSLVNKWIKTDLSCCQSEDLCHIHKKEALLFPSSFLILLTHFLLTFEFGD